MALVILELHIQGLKGFVNYYNVQLFWLNERINQYIGLKFVFQLTLCRLGLSALYDSFDSNTKLFYFGTALSIDANSIFIKNPESISGIFKHIDYSELKKVSNKQPLSLLHKF